MGRPHEAVSGAMQWWLEYLDQVDKSAEQLKK
jgi:hypothetical protein